MLQVKNVKKKYVTGELVQTALDDVSLNLRDNEFVAVLCKIIFEISVKQDDVTQYYRRTGQIRRRRSDYRRRIDETVQRQGLGYLPQPCDRVRFSELQSDSPPVHLV